MSPDQARSQSLIAVPGSAASSFNGCGILHSLLRHLLTSPCRLGSFSRSLLAWQFAPCDDEATGSAEIFPMPLPVPEVFRDKTSTPERRCGAEEGSCYSCHCFEFPLFAPTMQCWRCIWWAEGAEQETVRRMQRFARAWAEVSLITLEIMGRASAKVESLVKTPAVNPMSHIGHDDSSQRWFKKESGLSGPEF